MIIFGACLSDEGQRFNAIALPAIERAALHGDLILTESGDKGICRAYNQLIKKARRIKTCQALVLLHEDCEIVDANFRAKALAACSQPFAGVTGVIGGSGLRDLAWWNARETAGFVYETRGFVEKGPRRASVDTVDGLLMIVSPLAFGSLEFDAKACPRYHGYDVDFCLQALEAGMENRVVPIDLLHRTAGGYGDKDAWNAAAATVAKKWPRHIKPETIVVASSSDVRHAGAPSRTSAAADSARCAACCAPLTMDSDTEGQTIVECPECGLGVIWPPPVRDVTGDGLFLENYGGNRLARRDQWHVEARLRVDWVLQTAPEGSLLEIGSATGEFVRAALDAGFDAYGVEVSEWAAKEARQLDVDVVTGYLDEWKSRYPGMRPDAIAMWHVLEHVPDPAALLGDIRDLLAPGGHLFLEVPNYGSCDARPMGLEWDGAQPKDHYHLFNSESLGRLLERCGYETCLVQPLSIRVYAPLDRWRSKKNKALIEKREWPPLDLLRAIAMPRGRSGP